MIRSILAALCVAGCTATVEPSNVGQTYLSLPNPPDALRSCPGPVVSPPTPKTPRTIETVAKWAGKVEVAREATEKARAECARRLYRLNEWVKQAEPEAAPTEPE